MPRYLMLEVSLRDMGGYGSYWQLRLIIHGSIPRNIRLYPSQGVSWDGMGELYMADRISAEHDWSMG